MQDNDTEAVTNRLEKSDDEWRRGLTGDEFDITRRAGTEAAFSGVYWDTKTPGIYNCKCCDTPLFDSETKYDSGSGWPSFYAPIDASLVDTHEDLTLGMRRIEATCAVCDAHLGHIFPDGPQPTGLRFCLNSASLNLAPRDFDEQ
mgnify:CR=1 FL=1